MEKITRLAPEPTDTQCKTWWLAGGAFSPRVSTVGRGTGVGLDYHERRVQSLRA